MDRKRKDRGGGKAAADAAISEAQSKLKKEQEPERSVIDAGLCFVDGRTGQLWRVFTCSDNQESSSWIDSAAGGVPTPKSARHVVCYHHKTPHRLISLSEAAQMEVLNIQEGNVCVPVGQIVSMLLDPKGKTPKVPITSLSKRRAS